MYRFENAHMVMMQSSKLGRSDILRLALAAGADVHKEHDESDGQIYFLHWPTALIHAAAAGHSDTVTVLLDHGADINHGSDIGWTTALHGAAANGHLGLVKQLLEAGARVNTWSIRTALLTPLCCASISGHAEIAKLLLAWGAEVDQERRKDERALYMAAKRGHIDTVRVLLEHGADPNLGVVTARHAAMAEEHWDVVELLSEWEARRDRGEREEIAA